MPAVLAVRGAAMVAGGDRLLAIAEWGRAPHGGAPLAARRGVTRATTPCVATRHRVCRRLAVAAFERAGGPWAAQATAVGGAE